MIPLTAGSSSDDKRRSSLSAEARAEKIITKILCQDTRYVPSHILSEIAAEIEEVFEEGRRKGQSEMISPVECKKRIEDAFEHAAKIADVLLSMNGPEIARILRAKAKELK